MVSNTEGSKFTLIQKVTGQILAEKAIKRFKKKRLQMQI